MGFGFSLEYVAHFVNSFQSLAFEVFIFFLVVVKFSVKYIHQSKRGYTLFDNNTSLMFWLSLENQVQNNYKRHLSRPEAFKIVIALYDHHGKIFFFPKKVPDLF